jgi:hypothetical protein
MKFSPGFLFYRTANRWIPLSFNSRQRQLQQQNLLDSVVERFDLAVFGQTVREPLLA